LTHPEPHMIAGEVSSAGTVAPSSVVFHLVSVYVESYLVTPHYEPGQVTRAYKKVGHLAISPSSPLSPLSLYPRSFAGIAFLDDLGRSIFSLYFSISLYISFCPSISISAPTQIQIYPPPRPA
jgi:hypothetical protein